VSFEKAYCIARLYFDSVIGSVDLGTERRLRL